MNKISYFLVVLTIGFGIGYLVNGILSPAPKVETHVMSDGSVMSDQDMSMGNAMDDMLSGLSGLTGDAFDKSFLEQMIVHHEGAVAMAEAALRDAKREEIKDLANEIISAQIKEIAQMRDWQKSWYNR